MSRCTADNVSKFKLTYQSSPASSLHSQRRDNRSRTLLDLIKAYRTCGCFDVRDRVYGLLGLVESSALEVDYNLSKAELFQRVLSTYPAGYAEGIAKPIAMALELSADELMRDVVAPTLLIPMRVQECGYLTRPHISLRQERLPYRGGELFRWNENKAQMIAGYSYLARQLDYGDQLYTWSLLRPEGSSGNGRGLIVLRRSTYRDDHESELAGSRKVLYDIAGIAQFVDSVDNSRVYSAFVSEQPLSTTKAFQRVYRREHGPLEIELQLLDFIKLSFAHGKNPKQIS